MSLISDSIPNLIGGVSQQAAPIRRPNQFSENDNTYATVVDGLRKRAPSEHQFKLMTGTGGVDAFWHTINRDQNERYQLAITDGDIQVFDIDTGLEKTVDAPSGNAYLLATTPRTAFRVVTVADYTFIVNLDTEVALDAADKSAARSPEALVHVRQGNYGRTYNITVQSTSPADGPFTGTYTVPDGSSAAHTANVATDYIATQLVASLVALRAAGANNWNFVRYGSGIHITHDDGRDFTVSIEDGFAGNAMFLAKNRVQKFTDLPTQAPDGFVIEIVGDDGLEQDNYWLRFKKENAANSNGVWVETVKPDIVVGFDATTMPHALVRNEDGTFTFDVIAWQDRVVGDIVTNEQPSLVGQKVKDVFFYRNRLGFLAGENVVFSRAGDFFNLWRATVTTLLDDDPVDISVSHVKVSTLYSALPYNESLIMFSEQTQFSLDAGNLLTPSSSAINATTEFAASRNVRPVGAAQSAFFIVEQDGFAQVREFYYSGDTQVYDAYNATAHAPKYIPSGVFKMTASTAEDVLVICTSGDTDAVYVYKWVGPVTERAQAAWQRWIFDGATVLNAEFVESNLYVVLQRDGDTWLERISIAPGRTDDGQEFTIHLDRRVANSSLPAASYDSVDDETTFTMPYTVAGTTARAVVRYSVGYTAIDPGVELDVVSRSGVSLVVSGDHTATPAYLGVPYTATAVLSPFYVRQQKGDRGIVPVADGRLQLRYLTFLLATTAYFTVEVTPEGRDTFSYVYNGRVLGDNQSVLGAVGAVDGRFRVPIMSKGDTVRVEITNDSYLPMSLLALEWEGLFIIRSRRI